MGRLVRNGVSGIIVEALLLVVGVSLAILFSSTVMSKLSEFQSRFTVISSQTIQSFSEKLTYVHATYNSSEGCFLIYIKNAGSYAISSLDRATTIFGPIGAATYIPFSNSPAAGCGCWNYVEYEIVNNALDPYETIAIKIYNSTPLTPPYYFKFVTSRGTSLEAEFSSLLR